MGWGPGFGEGGSADSPCEWGCERAAKGICGLLFLGAAETFLPISAAVSVQFICDELSLMSLFFFFPPCILWLVSYGVEYVV